MKRTIQTLLALSIIAAILPGCLKDKDYDSGKIQSGHLVGESKVIEIGLTATSTKNFLNLSLAATNSDTTISLIPVRLASAQPATEDITVKLVKNDALITAYNAANGTAYTVPSATQLSVLNTDNVVVIPKGQYEGYLRVKFNASNFLGHEYALGFSIGTVQNSGYTASGNLKNGIVAFAIKNRYDGHYRVTGNMHDLALSTITGRYPFEVDLITVDANTVDMYLTTGPTTGYYHPISSNGAPSVYGNYAPEFVFNTGSNKVTDVVNAYGQHAMPQDRSGALDATGLNDFNPATQTIRVNYFMLQPGTTVRTKFSETFTYVRPRQ